MCTLDWCPPAPCLPARYPRVLYIHYPCAYTTDDTCCITGLYYR